MFRIDKIVQSVYFKDNEDQYEIKKFSVPKIDLENIVFIQSYPFIIDIIKSIKTQ